MAVVAAVPAAAALPALASHVESGGQLATLVKQYFDQVDIFNATEHQTDEESDAHAAATFETTMRRMAETPIRSADDAVALVDWMEDEDMIEAWCGDFEGFTEALVSKLRAYLAGRIA